MAVTYTMPEANHEGGGGNFLDTPGRFHFLVHDFEMEPKKKDSEETIPGWHINMEVLNPGDCQGKQIRLTLWNSKRNEASEEDVEKRDYDAEKQAAALIAMGLVRQSQRGSRVTFEPDDAANRQLFAEFSYRKVKNPATMEYDLDYEDENGRKQLQLHFSNIYHVCDPRAASFPRNQGMLDKYPRDLLLDSSEFRGRKSASNGATNGSNGNGASNPAPISTPSVAEASGVSAADLS